MLEAFTIRSLCLIAASKMNDYLPWENPEVETSMRKATTQKTQSRVTRRMPIAWALSTIIPKCHESQSLILFPNCVRKN